jgi:Cof subfamily protein (haloacid dehalogenase superfamily)
LNCISKNNVNIINALYVSDLDGTLLNDKGYLSEYTSTILKQAMDAGLHFTIATGKSMYTIRDIIGSIHFTLPIITHDGTSLWLGGKHIRTITLKRDKLLRAVDVMLEVCASLLVFSIIDNEERIFWCTNYINNETKKYFLKRSNDPRFQESRNINEMLLGDILFITCLSDEITVKKLSHILNTNRIYNYIQRDNYIKDIFWLKVKNEDVNKYSASKYIMDMYGFKKLISFGDEVNDLLLLKNSDFSIAVGNANISVKRYANKVIDTNNNDGVAKYIAQLLSINKMK